MCTYFPMPELILRFCANGFSGQIPQHSENIFDFECELSRIDPFVIVLTDSLIGAAA